VTGREQWRVHPVRSGTPPIKHPRICKQKAADAYRADTPACGRFPGHPSHELLISRHIVDVKGPGYDQGVDRCARHLPYRLGNDLDTVGSSDGGATH